MLRPAISALLIGIAVAILVAGGALLWGYGQFKQAGPADQETTLVFERGSSVAQIAEQLAVAGVISNPDVFIIAARLQPDQRGLKAGEYRFAARASIVEVLVLLQAGETVVRRLTVPEGLTTHEVLALVLEAEGLSGAVGPPPPEGSLLPETYHYSFGDSRSVVLERMRQAMQRALVEVWAKRAADLPLAGPGEAVVLASLVEKETGVAAERARIASVFVNRLRRDMRLQSDPTVAYALTEGRKKLARALTRADLATPSPFNTYQVKGLPPTPIANPGRAALEAAVRPLATDDLYFVADGDGGHAFARTFKEHQDNVRQWRRFKANSKKQ